jgi:hypothetical protein
MASETGSKGKRSNDVEMHGGQVRCRGIGVVVNVKSDSCFVRYLGRMIVVMLACMIEKGPQAGTTRLSYTFSNRWEVIAQTKLSDVIVRTCPMDPY